MEKSDIFNKIIEVIRINTADESITALSSIQNDVGLDSIGWLRCLIGIERVVGIPIAPHTVFRKDIESVEDLCNVILDSLSKAGEDANVQ